jgi:hypothetical protein
MPAVIIKVYTALNHSRTISRINTELIPDVSETGFISIRG